MTNRHDPFEEIESLFDRMSSQFEDLGREVESELPAMVGGDPRVDVAETNEEIRVTADLPGFERDDIEVTVDGMTLTISAERSEEEAETTEDARYHRHERRHQSVSRRIRLPTDVAADDAEATHSNGVLTVRLPKVDPDAGDGHRIEVE